MSGVRVIAGTAKGRKLNTRKAKNLRPATDFVKEALFNILVQRVPGSSFLDLFSGSGSIGIEALSRGAVRAVFVEGDPQNAQLIKENLTITGFQDRGEVFVCDVFRGLQLIKSRGYHFDLAFLDPPFRKGYLKPVYSKLVELGLISPGGLIVTRSAFGEENGVSDDPVREGRYGDSVLRFYKVDDARYGRSEPPDQ